MKTNKTDPEFPDYPTFYGTIVDSKEWKEWVKKNEEDPKWDVHEAMETGWLSPVHWLAFLNFVRGL